MADDFRAEVERTWAESDAFGGGDGHPYTVDRVGGGLAVAKTIPMTSDRSRFHIVIDGMQLGEFLDPQEWAYSTTLIAHELVHPLLERLRWASGAMEGVNFPSHTPSEYARSISRCAFDELRADLVAGMVLGQMFTATPQDGAPRPMTIVDVIGDGQRLSVGEVLDDVVYPGWPDLVQSFRTRRIDLERMWSTLVSQTDQAMTLLAHVEAQAVGTDRTGPLEAEFAGHRGTCLYLGPAWGAILDAGRQNPLPTLSEFREQEHALLREGEEAIIQMWERLGLSFEDLAEPRTFYIHVGEPAR
ncbi:hypothetical protein [Frankia sp. AvcI1]|uniref:hypothetical protein n=1 Tax=Frankia sp. AvcI1 TaxID=573496 RepID=UPI0021186E00|nr:hypothetical protein [Frankia sp. AvcI1]